MLNKENMTSIILGLKAVTQDIIDSERTRKFRQEFGGSSK